MKFPSIFLLLILVQQAKGQQTTADNSSAPVLVHFTPVSFSNKFSLNVAPALRVRPGDTVATETIDAAGYDKNGVKRQKGGNPLTGPFYVEQALPGDVLEITLIKIALNRPRAFTTESFASRSLPKALLKGQAKTRLIQWKLDTQSGYATPVDSSYEHLQSYQVPLSPFIGCIGVAPATKRNEVLSFFQGPYGGNLDFKDIAQSAIVYLPVFHEGAYLYFGDGHALQGDGELAGNALETSLDIAFTVRIIKKDPPGLEHPRVENATHLMAIGIDKSLDNAIKKATAGLLDWLQADYHLTYPEATQVLSTSIEYTIAEIADPAVEIVAKIKKGLLKGIRK